MIWNAIEMEPFHRRVNKHYRFLYDNGGYVAGYKEAVALFDQLISTNESFQAFIQKCAAYRQDPITSDREAAAFMFALEFYFDSRYPIEQYIRIADEVRSEYEVELVLFRIYGSERELFKAERKNLSSYAEETNGQFLGEEENVFRACGKWVYATEWY